MRRRRRKAKWSWSARRARAHQGDFTAVMDRLAALPRDEAAALLIDIATACREAGVAPDLLLPEESWFLERQHERAVRALIEISAGEKSAAAMARWAWKTVQINHRAESDKIAESSAAAPPAPDSLLYRVA